MKQQRLSLSLLILIVFCGLVLRFPAAQSAAAETPVPKAMPAATGAAGISPTPSPSPVPPSVRWVGVRNWQGEQRKTKKIYAQRGDKIWVDIINFDDWVNSLGDKKPDKHEWKNLILFLDHIPLPGVAPFYSHEQPEPYYTKDSIPYKIRTVGFPLVRNDTSKPGWSHLLNQPRAETG